MEFMKWSLGPAAGGGGAVPARPRLAQDAPELNSGDTAWMLVATVLVLFMTIPGLSLFAAACPVEERCPY